MFKLRGANTMSTVYHTITIDYGEEMLEVELSADVKIVDNGIGPYEYWGYKGHHHQWEPEVENIEYNYKEYTQSEREAIDRYIDEHEEQIINEICEHIDIDDL